ncbi:MAG: DUF2156 domain-containing protein [Candidatus Omnitrophica bacterium]|nr:DUF2156 domain-containing protein [Candidatus Omnitrophota bacterium]
MLREKLSLDHKELLHGRLKSARSFLSEYSFSNLYLFRDSHDYHIIKEADSIFVSGKTYDGFRHVMPTGEISVADLSILKGLLHDYDFIFPVPEEWLGAFGGRNLKPSFVEGDSDYVYSVEQLATYKGSKFHDKKNLLNQFLSLYTPEAYPLTKERMGDAQIILDAWQEDVGGEKTSTDYFPCRDGLALYDELVLCGGIYYVNGEPAGFILGEEINDAMFVFHFAKGRRKFKGMYQYMYNHFAGILPAKYTHINFEQDLGKLALKIAKSSYHPQQMLHKYRVSFVSDPAF